MIKFFNRNKKWSMTKKNTIIDFDNHHVSSWQVVSFLYFLYKQYGYNYIVEEYHCGRCYLHYYGNLPLGIKRFFNDRNPAQIEELCRTLPSFTGTVNRVKYDNGFDQMIFIEKETDINECEEEEG